MKVYIAGPYSSNPDENVETAIAYAELLAYKGHTPFIPHLTHFWEQRYHHDYEFWMNQDLEWLKMCDCLLRIPGTSIGADREVQNSIAYEIPVYYNVNDIPTEP